MPEWLTDVLTVVATALTVALAVTKLNDRNISQAVEKAGRETDQAIRRAVEELKGNDFNHVHKRLDAVQQDFGERLTRMEDRAREARAEARADRREMEERLLAAIRGGDNAPEGSLLPSSD